MKTSHYRPENQFRNTACGDAGLRILRASGYFALQPHLRNVPLIRIIVGIDVDSLLAASHRKGLLHLGDANKTLEEVRKELQRDIARAPYRREVEDGIRQFVTDVADKRVQIRAHPTKRLHAKIYIFLPPGFSEHKPGAVITGSSNRNLVLLFQDGKNSTVIGNLQHFFAQRIKEYDVAKRIKDERKRHAEIVRIYELIREQVVTPLTVRRTRRDLLEDKRYKADLIEHGVTFPEVEKLPSSIASSL